MCFASTVARSTKVRLGKNPNCPIRTGMRANVTEALHMFRCAPTLTALTIGLLAPLTANSQQSTVHEITAIDILLEPDATMVSHAKATNERLLKSFPKEFALGKAHQPHI